MDDKLDDLVEMYKFLETQNAPRSRKYEWVSNW